MCALHMISKDAVRLQPWIVTLLVTVLFASLSVVGTAAMTYQTVIDLKERIINLEHRLELMEQRR